VLLRARDDLRVEPRQLLREREIVLAERVGARAVVQVQHAEHAAVVQQRHRQRRLDVEPLAHDPEALAIGLAAQPQRAPSAATRPAIPSPKRTRIFGHSSRSTPTATRTASSLAASRRRA
jgi:hypothetical protein